MNSLMMEELMRGRSPVFPVEKDVDVSSDAEPLSGTSSIQVFIRLVEPVVFLQGFNQTQQSEVPPSMLRGSLVVRVLKPSKLKSISLSFKGYSRTEWPEGIPPKRQEFVESSDIVNHVWPFYQNDGTTTNSKSGHSDDQSFLLRESGASMYRKLETVKHRSNSVSADSVTSDFSVEPEHHVAGKKRSNSNSKEVLSSPGSSSRTLSPMSMLRRVTSGSSSKHEKSTNLISDLLSSTFSNDQGTRSRRNSASSNASGNTLNAGAGDSGIASGSGDHFVFQPGDYIYTFEQAIPSSYPETVKADFGFVEYHLHANIERVGAFKSNIAARLPVPLVRTQSDFSVEETEAIAISRDWEDQLHYDIVIASKDIILDAFLPIAFHFSPLDKVVLHRIRIYLTETMEYYCRGKKVHRMEPTRKILLAEHNGPNVADPDDKGPVKAKDMGNLLLDENSGDLVNKDYEYQVYVPAVTSGRHVLHPDTSFDKIKSNHWIKLCLRLSKMVDGKRKHYEISIDSPIHVLHRLCSHANTLLPSYDSHTVTNQQALSTCPKFGNTENINIYHDSNIFFPKEVLLSPVVSPEVHPMDLRVTKTLRNYSSQMSMRTRNSKITDDVDTTFSSPRLRSNIYQPGTIRRELASPQAIPLSPMVSPLPVTTSWQDAPPPFDYDGDDLSLSSDLPPDPPLYADVLRQDELEKRRKSSSTSRTPELPKITLNRSNEEEQPATLDEQLAADSFSRRTGGIGKARKNLEASFKDSGKGSQQEEEETFGFNFQSRSRSPMMFPPSSDVRPPPKASLPFTPFSDQDSKIYRVPSQFSSPLATTDIKPPKRSLATNTLPATVRNDTSAFTGLGDVFDDETPHGSFSLNRINTNDTAGSNSSSLGGSSIDSVAVLSNRSNVAPLIERTDSGFHASTDDISTQSRKCVTIPSYAESSVSTPVHITAPYYRDSNPWHYASVNPEVPDVNPFHHNYGGQDFGIPSAKEPRHLGNPFYAPEPSHQKRSSQGNIDTSSHAYRRFSPEKQLVSEIGTEAASSPGGRSLFC